MAELNIAKRTIKDLFQDKNSDFLIPDYQRPYAWGVEECKSLWEDIFSFAIPEEGSKTFDSKNEYYFLGPIVSFKNNDKKMEIIDGQQRLTTLMLLLRAFYSKFMYMKDEYSISARENIEQCIWETDEFDKPNKNALKIGSEVATDNDKGEFLDILKTGNIENKKSRYAKNYKFFQEQIQEFSDKYPTYVALLPTRIMNNCILLPIETESQDTALRIFSTLNDRGKPLSDADIFKAEFYKFYSKSGKKDDFIKAWKELEVLCGKIFHPNAGTAMDELFTRYMYYERAKKNIKSSTTEALRKFYEKDSYSILKKEETFENLKSLANFWDDISNQDIEKFSEETLRRLFVLNYAPNGMWTYFVSVYYMHNKDVEGRLEEEKFNYFLDKITAFILTYAVVMPGVNALRTPIYAEMINIVNNEPVTLEEYKFEEEKVRSMFSDFSFKNGRPITKSMATWWAFQNEEQELLSLDTVFEIEHIYAKNRQKFEKSLIDVNNLEALGNKSLLEKFINIRASDYRFSDKKRYYTGQITGKNGVKKKGTQIKELVNIAKTADFTETDIVNRTENIMDKFIEYLKQNDLLI